MNTMKVVLASLLFCGGIATVQANEQECQKLQEQKSLIYAAHGYCFKDKTAQKQYGNDDCHTNRPKFSDAENKRLAQIEEKQKTLNCPKKDL